MVIIDFMTTSLEENGGTLLKSESFSHPQAKFLKFYFLLQNNGKPVYGLQYSTVLNQRTYNITMRSFSGEIDNKKKPS